MRYYHIWTMGAGDHKGIRMLWCGDVDREWCYGGDAWCAMSVPENELSATMDDIRKAYARRGAIAPKLGTEKCTQDVFVFGCDVLDEHPRYFVHDADTNERMVPCAFDSIDSAERWACKRGYGVVGWLKRPAWMEERFNAVQAITESLSMEDHIALCNAWAAHRKSIGRWMPLDPAWAKAFLYILHHRQLIEIAEGDRQFGIISTFKN